MASAIKWRWVRGRNREALDYVTIKFAITPNCAVQALTRHADHQYFAEGENLPDFTANQISAIVREQYRVAGEGWREGVLDGVTIEAYHEINAWAYTQVTKAWPDQAASVTWGKDSSELLAAETGE